jgi:hypothetical protein
MSCHFKPVRHNVWIQKSSRQIYVHIPWLLFADSPGSSTDPARSPLFFCLPFSSFFQASILTRFSTPISDRVLHPLFGQAVTKHVLAGTSA